MSLEGGVQKGSPLRRSGRYPVDVDAIATSIANRNIPSISYYEGIKVYVRKNVTDGDESAKTYRLKPLDECTVAGNPATEAQWGSENQHWELDGHGGTGVGTGYWQVDIFTNITSDAINGSNTEYNLTYEPNFIVSATINGLDQLEGVDYNLVGQKIIMTSPIPATFNSFVVKYTRVESTPQPDSPVTTDTDDFTQFNNNIIPHLGADYYKNKMNTLQITADNKASLHPDFIIWLEKATKNATVALYRPIRTEWFYDLETALEIAEAGDTIHLYADTYENIVLKDGVDIDFHGHSITGTNTLLPVITNVTTILGTPCSCNIINIGGCTPVSGSNVTPIIIQGNGGFVNITGFRLGASNSNFSIEYKGACRGSVKVDELSGVFVARNTTEVNLEARQIPGVYSNDSAKLVARVNRTQQVQASNKSDLVFYGHSEGSYAVISRTSNRFLFFGSIKSTFAPGGSYALIMGDLNVTDALVETHKFSMIGDIECIDTAGLWVVSGECKFKGNIKARRVSSAVGQTIPIKLGSYGGVTTTSCKVYAEGNIDTNDQAIAIGNVGINKEIYFKGNILQTTADLGSAIAVISAQGGKLDIDANIICDSNVFTCFNGTITRFRGMAKVLTPNKYIWFPINVIPNFINYVGIVNGSNTFSTTDNGTVLSIKLIGHNVFNFPIHTNTPAIVSGQLTIDNTLTSI